MIPRSSMLCCHECVGARLARSERTFGNSIGTVHRIGVELPNAMPVEAGSIIGETVLDGNLESVAPSSSDCRSWKLTVYSVYNSRMSIGCKGEILNFKIVANNSASAWPCRLYVCVDIIASSPALPSCWTIEAVGIGNVGGTWTRSV